MIIYIGNKEGVRKVKIKKEVANISQRELMAESIKLLEGIEKIVVDGKVVYCRPGAKSYGK